MNVVYFLFVFHFFFPFVFAFAVSSPSLFTIFHFFLSVLHFFPSSTKKFQYNVNLHSNLDGLRNEVAYKLCC